MLMPKKYKYRKQQKSRMRGSSKTEAKLHFGNYGLVALETGWITSRQIEASRVAITRHMKRAGKLWIMIFPHKPITKKPAETRMGKGKGDVDRYVSVVKRGKVMFELTGVADDVALTALNLAQHKLPIKTRIIKKAMEGGL